MGTFDPPIRTEPTAMIFVPGGPFIQGIDEAGLDALVEICRAFASNPEACERERLIEHHRNEAPQRRVDLAAFEIDRTEVTNSDYAACVEAGGCPAIDLDACTFFPDEGGWVLGGQLDAAQRAPSAPVVCVRWAEAARYCAWAGKRLPLEAEWEKAARGADARRFPWGDEWDASAANWSSAADGYTTVAPVGSFPAGASPYGALDMAGNVWEWVEEPYAEPGAEGSAAEPRRIMRGGGYAANPIGLRTTKRVAREPGGWVNVGFRCARSRR